MHRFRWLVFLATWVVGAAAGLLAARLLVGAWRWLEGGYAAAAVILLDVLRLAFPVTFALVLAERLQRHPRARTLPRWPLILSAWFVGALTGVLAFALLAASLRWLDQPFGPPRLIGDGLFAAVAVTSALALSSWVRSRVLPHVTETVSWRPLRRAMLALFLGLYCVTWGFGVPAVTTELVRRDVATFKHSHTIGDPDYRERYPVLNASFGAPLLPGIVLVYYESQLGGQSGAGGWHLFAWWGFGTRPLAFFWRWLS